VFVGEVAVEELAANAGRELLEGRLALLSAACGKVLQPGPYRLRADVGARGSPDLLDSASHDERPGVVEELHQLPRAPALAGLGVRLATGDLQVRHSQLQRRGQRWPSGAGRLAVLSLRLVDHRLGQRAARLEKALDSQCAQRPDASPG